MHILSTENNLLVPSRVESVCPMLLAMLSVCLTLRTKEEGSSMQFPIFSWPWKGFHERDEREEERKRERQRL